MSSIRKALRAQAATAVTGLALFTTVAPGRVMPVQARTLAQAGPFAMIYTPSEARGRSGEVLFEHAVDLVVEMVVVGSTGAAVIDAIDDLSDAVEAALVDEGFLDALGIDHVETVSRVEDVVEDGEYLIGAQRLGLTYSRIAEWTPEREQAVEAALFEADLTTPKNELIDAAFELDFTDPEEEP